ncbi:probable CCG-9 trehalose synthase (clock-controlled gene-9) [Fusarium oxysporum]|uniref:Probable CCG-9 trehalose synthase (Clock-controlled gene-9) n=1 Tax=Fusarium oxysporum TaxID=5507 RepID=A0A2H3T790_FUSOX|nr:probable CCG-9 trehalose synthase (clock-controlled gene-9) [Fusarium oxysporum]
MPEPRQEVQREEPHGHPTDPHHRSVILSSSGRPSNPVSLASSAPNIASSQPALPADPSNASSSPAHAHPTANPQSQPGPSGGLLTARHEASRPKSLRPFILSVMAFKKSRKFSRPISLHRKRQMSTIGEEEGQFGPALTTLYLGISGVFSDDQTAIISLAINDSIYLLDFSVKHIVLDNVLRMDQDPIADYILEEVEKYEHENFAKFVGAGLPTTLRYMSPSLCSRLWLDLDIVPIVLRPDSEEREKSFWDVKRVDEQADSMARKCVMHFGPSLAPHQQVAFRGVVQTDAGFRANLVTLHNYKDTCSAATWKAMLTYAEKLRHNGIRIAFFSSTPQGGGVALMRHALVRFARLVGVNLAWYVPKPLPRVFRITKNIHNVLQGVSPPDERITAEEKDAIMGWITENAQRYWLADGGPLRQAEEGGAHIVIVSILHILVLAFRFGLESSWCFVLSLLAFGPANSPIDDPQMPGLIPLIKNITPDRPVLYRSHIQIRSDLIAKAGSPQADIWDFLWSHIQLADMFISHPVPNFVPHTVPREKVVYFPATTDWLDGLNKELNDWDSGFYGHMYNDACHSQRMTELDWPARKYIIQMARFDPSKGIPTVIDSYAEFHRQCETAGITNIPQLIVCGNGSIDDPDGNMVYDQTIGQLQTYYPQLIKDISIMRLRPNDQLLNTLIAKAHVVLQLSIREGFEVKVSEALHAGRPVIATKAGGIPLQVKDKMNGFLVDPGDWKAVAGYLMDLFTNDDLHKKMSHAARTGVSDEVGTVGNALGWFYLATKWAESGVVERGNGGLWGNERWVNDMAREEADCPYSKSENRLPRHFTEKKAHDAKAAELVPDAPAAEV